MESLTPAKQSICYTVGTTRKGMVVSQNLVLPEGFRIKYKHYRVSSNDGNLHPKGGDTYAMLFNAEGEPVAEGYAFCSEQDTYNRRHGNSIAGGRVLKSFITQQTVWSKPRYRGGEELEAFPLARLL